MNMNDEWKKGRKKAKGATRYEGMEPTCTHMFSSSPLFSL